MHFRDLTTEEWNSYGDVKKLRYAQRLAAHLPQAVRATAVQTFRFGDRQETLAIFEWQGSDFVLIPGSTVTVGYDAGGFRPTPEQLRSFQDSASAYGIDDDIQSFVQKVTTQLRTATITPMLVEVIAREIGLEPLPPQSPEARGLLKGAGQVEVDKTIRVRREQDGSAQAWRIVKKTHPQVMQQLHAVGLRLPTSDEWEYLCGAGTQTLFRWGDFFPCDRYPTDTSPADARRRRERLLAGGKLDEPDWDLHLQPNAFSLAIAHNPYDCEVVAEPGSVRGGDGGGNICGGVGFFLGWLPLATAYQDEAATAWLEEDISNLFLRRVIPVE